MKLTQNQYEVLRSLKQGRTLSETASFLNLSQKTVNRRSDRLRQKGLVISNGRGKPVSVSDSVDLRSLRHNVVG